MEKTSPWTLANELSWRFPLSYREVSVLNGRIVGIFAKTWVISDNPYRADDFEVQIVFYPDHEAPYGYRFGAITCHGEELPPEDYQADLGKQYQTVLIDHGWKAVEGENSEH